MKVHVKELIGRCNILVVFITVGGHCPSLSIREHRFYWYLRFSQY